MLKNKDQDTVLARLKNAQATEKILDRLARGDYRHVLFDWDGTIVTSHLNIAHAFSTASESICGKLLSREQVSAYIGLPLQEMFIRLIGEPYLKSLNAFLKRFVQYYIEGCEKGEEQILPGISQLLAWLSRQAISMSIVSNKRTRTLEASSKNSGLRHFFIHQLDAEKFQPKPDSAMCRFIEANDAIAATDILMIGDSKVDALFAHQSGCDFLCLAAQAQVDQGDKQSAITATSVLAYLCAARTKVR